MSTWRIVGLAVFLLMLFGLSGVLARPDALRTPPPVTATMPARQADPEATAYVHQALAALDPKQVAWLECGVWQKVHLPGLAYEAEGTYQAGPERRVRLELRTHVQGCVGRVLWVENGVWLWQAMSGGRKSAEESGGHKSAEREWREITWVNWPEVQQAVPMGVPASAALDEVYDAYAVGGPGPLLRHLKESVVWSQRQVVRRLDAGREQEFHKLAGVPQPNHATQNLEDRKAGQPRHCRLYLDRQTLWPARLEWWGPLQDGGDDELLTEQEFRAPVRNRLPSVELWERAFTLDPGTTPVVNKTLEAVTLLRVKLGGKP